MSSICDGNNLDVPSPVVSVPGSPKTSSKSEKEVDTRVSQAVLNPTSSSTSTSTFPPSSSFPLSSGFRAPAPGIQDIIRVLFDKTFHELSEGKGTLLDFKVLANLSGVNVSANKLSHAHQNSLWKKLLQTSTQKKHTRDKIGKLSHAQTIEICKLIYKFKISLNDLSSFSSLPLLNEENFWEQNLYQHMKELAFSAIERSPSNIGLLKFLLATGLKPNAVCYGDEKEFTGKTCLLDSAISCENKEAMRVLLNAGASKHNINLHHDASPETFLVLKEKPAVQVPLNPNERQALFEIWRIVYEENPEKA